MRNQIEINIQNGIYDNNLTNFKKDAIEMLNVGFELGEYDGVSEKIYEKAYIENNVYGLDATLQAIAELAIFFKENMQLVFNSIMNQ